MSPESESHKISDKTRREFLQIGLAGAAATVLAAPALAQTKPDVLVVTDGGGLVRDAYLKAYYEPFTAKTGIKVLPQPYIGAGEIKAIVENKAYSQCELALLSASGSAMLQREDLIEKIDYGMIDRSDFLLDGLAADNWFIVMLTGNVICWNTDRYPGDKAPKTWMEFFGTSGDVKGRKGFWKNAGQTLDVAALGSGIPKDKLYPLDVDAALAMLTKVRADSVFWTSGAQAQELLINGEVDMSFMWNGRAHQLKSDGHPIDYTYNDALLEGDSVAIPKGSPNARWAQELAATIANPENQAKFTSLIPYGPVTKAGAALVPKERLLVTASAPQNLTNSLLQNFEWWSQNGDEATKRFTEWSVG